MSLIFGKGLGEYPPRVLRCGNYLLHTDLLVERVGEPQGLARGSGFPGHGTTDRSHGTAAGRCM